MHDLALFLPLVALMSALGEELIATIRFLIRDHAPPVGKQVGDVDNAPVNDHNSTAGRDEKSSELRES